MSVFATYAWSRRKSGQRFICRERFQDGVPVRTNLQDRYDVVIDDHAVEDALEANIPLGKAALGAAIQEYRDHISFVKKT